jgi:hypothetical protein
MHEEVKILDAKKYNDSTRATYPLNIESKRKPTKYKCGKNKIIPSSVRNFKYLTLRSTTIRHEQYMHLLYEVLENRQYKNVDKTK